MQAQQDIWASPVAPPADAPSPLAVATPENPPAEAPEPPLLHTESDAEEGVNVDVNVKAPRGIFFVRLTLQVGLQTLLHGIALFAQNPWWHSCYAHGASALPMAESLELCQCEADSACHATSFSGCRIFLYSPERSWVDDAACRN